jgi:hypothetical protein
MQLLPLSLFMALHHTMKAGAFEAGVSVDLLKAVPRMDASTLKRAVRCLLIFPLSRSSLTTV